VTDPHTPRHEHSRLEPWALELEASEPGGPDPRRREELERVVAVLRSMPEPESPAGLSEAILSRVAADASRPRLLRVSFGTASRAAALALAAGIAGLLVVADAPGGLAPLLPGLETDTPDSLVIQIPDRALGQGFAAASAVPRAAGTQLVSLGSATPPTHYESPFAGVSGWERHLDRHLNQLQLDPQGYAQRLENAEGRDPFISHLARRAGARGDAPEIAMRVRTSQHPVAGQIVQRMLRASLIEHVSPR